MSKDDFGTKNSNFVILVGINIVAVKTRGVFGSSVSISCLYFILPLNRSFKLKGAGDGQISPRGIRGSLRLDR